MTDPTPALLRCQGSETLQDLARRSCVTCTGILSIGTAVKSIVEAASRHSLCGYLSAVCRTVIGCWCRLSYSTTSVYSGHFSQLRLQKPGSRPLRLLQLGLLQPSEREGCVLFPSGVQLGSHLLANKLMRLSTVLPEDCFLAVPKMRN